MFSILIIFPSKCYQSIQVFNVLRKFFPKKFICTYARDNKFSEAGNWIDLSNEIELCISWEAFFFFFDRSITEQAVM